MVAHCIRDDFQAYLDASQCRDAGQVGKAGHQLYSEMLGRATIFNHHDPRVAEHHAYLSRAVERMRRLLAMPAPHRKVFLLCSHENRFQLEVRELLQLFEQLSSVSECFAILAVRFQACDSEERLTPGATSVLAEEMLGSSLEVFDLQLRGGHTGLFFESAEDEAVFKELLLPRVQGCTLGSDPLAAEFASEGQEGLGAGAIQGTANPASPSRREQCAPVQYEAPFATLEVVRPPRRSLSPPSKPVALGCHLVLKEAVGKRVMEVLGCKHHFEGAEQRCRRDLLGSGNSSALEAALLVIPSVTSNYAGLLATAAEFLREGSGIKAVLMPEDVASAMCSDTNLRRVRGLQFPPGFDLFRIEDPRRVVAGGIAVKKARPIEQPFVVVAAQPPDGSASERRKIHDCC